ncbi:sulfotransferase family protein [Frigidibacter sp. ROC022]|uniref:sulfotransferase family protein n=1 Tax=Frigidibacter sp. ROC022 TaxID=2971796 RepID=UPI00215B5F22|nr:sulfotransferase [Frigidibacter sp. ROC022]MCR8725874.1 sulfotransferase [Frigidibacter sp. ROC022]
MPIGFIFSLPRSGSTYAQRVLSAAPEIATTPETWLLPALFGIRSGDAPLADFAYDHVRAGLDDVLARLDDGEHAWREALRAAAEKLFSNFVGPGQTFLEKTPRNALFSREIVTTFPDAPVLFLWRNPLSIVASMNRTWGRGRWKAHFYHYDLYLGLPALIATARQFAGHSNVMAVRYEDLVARPEETWPAVFAHFGASYDPAYFQKPPKILSRMGDQTGQARYAGTATQPTGLWKTGFGGELRRRWAARYLAQLGDKNLGFMGYDRGTLLDGLSRDGERHWSDAWFLGTSRLYHLIEPYALSTKAGRTGRHRFARR